MNDKTTGEQLQVVLGPEYINIKPGGHAYIESHKVVSLANEIFGFDGWSSEIRKMELDHLEESHRRFSVGYSCIMRISLKSGSFREDVGYGSCVNMPSRYQACEKARKEAATDALKRALRLFGEALGNCIYNKDYVETVKRLKPEKLTFDLEDMRRPTKRAKREADEPGPAEIALPNDTSTQENLGIREKTRGKINVNRIADSKEFGNKAIAGKEAPTLNPADPIQAQSHIDLPSDYFNDDDIDIFNSQPPAPPVPADLLTAEAAVFTTGAVDDSNRLEKSPQLFDLSNSKIQNSTIDQSTSAKTYKK